MNPICILLYFNKLRKWKNRYRGGHPVQSRDFTFYSFSKFFLDFFYPIPLIKFGYYPNKYYLCGVI